ncbi:hypothetical protein PIB30_063654 [Stylosanthes scabra]|uniref:Putative plant transposon protein domain-containing protein n=1 Tax=Stylosanthes scabra TaxID=79078 RepID=A0ABU6YIZ8_9FABA|nr:hypothetical protein [Stylosanthes scabra]
MASKGKAPAKASSTRVHGSTSQQQPPLEIQLYETPAHEERGKILEERRALHERTIKFPKGEDTFEERILARGWGFMYEPSIPINLSWTQEFYANKTKKDQREIFLRGRKITCSVSTIEKTLGIPKFRGKCGYSEISEDYNNKTLNMDEVLQVTGKEGATWWEDPHNPVIPTRPKKKILNYEAWMWLKLVVCNINPTRHETTLSMEVVLLIYALMRDMPVCLASVMRYAMNADPTKMKTYLLIFPMFITKWARDNNVPRFPGDVMVKIPKSQQFFPMGSGVRMMKKLHLPFHHQIRADIFPRHLPESAKSKGRVEKGNAEEDDDFQSAEATGDSNAYAGEESVDDE